MNTCRLSAFLLVAFFSLGLLPAALTAKAVRNGSVQVELLAQDTAIQPGQPFWVVVKMDHDPHWHSYWINAGTGYPTALTWTLPEGYKAGPIVWPAPHTVKDTSGKVTGNGYEGTSYLFTQITPPANAAVGGNVTLKVLAEWLMCEDSCMPGDATITLSLPVSADKPGVNAGVASGFSKAFQELPNKPAGWTFSAKRDGKKITLTVASSGGVAHKPSELHYFDENNAVDYSADQTVREEKGGFVIEMSAPADATAEATGLKGILTAKTGWQPGAGYGGALIDASFSKGAAAAQSTEKPAPAVVVGKGSGSSPDTKSGPPSSGSESEGGAEDMGILGTFFGTLFLALMGGLVLNLMPCVFPVLGIKILGFVNQSGSDKSKVIKHGLVFAAGVLVSFWALAGLLLALRAGGEQLGWGFQLQSPAFVFGMAVFMLIFALNLSGLFEVGLSATGAGAKLQSKEGFAGSFFTGMLATLVATPCSAPFLAPALGAALALSPVESLMVFTAIAVGLALPYLLLSIFPQAIKMLPRPGAWMETFKQLMAFPLYATVAWLLWVLAGQTTGDDYALLWIAFGFVLVAMSAWAYGRFGQTYGKPTRQLIGRVMAVALLAWGVWIGWPHTMQAGSTSADSKAGYQVVWEKWSPEAVAAAQAAGKFAYVDFTARWCATCQTNKATVFSSDTVLTEFGKRDVVLFKADWTNKDPKITQELAKWNRSAVPFNLIYAPNQKTPVVLPELLTGGKVLDALAQVSNRS